MNGGSLEDVAQLNLFTTPTWSQSAIWPLVGPLLDYFSEGSLHILVLDSIGDQALLEVSTRKEACELLETFVEDLPENASPNLPEGVSSIQSIHYDPSFMPNYSLDH
jgi:hypothetical protein